MPNAGSRPRGYEDYTTAVICAIDFEMSAVRYMLDREHARLPTKPGDSNIYVLGELSGHDVVLACLPGNQGKGAAAIVATNMSRTFPSLKWRFLVGIGGGLPSSKHDIRLGDVVISMPDGLHGGIVQYDLGKDTDNDFRLKGFLWPPPEMLRGAVAMMRSDHLTAENKIEEFLSQMLRKSPRLSIYARPSAEPDILFEPDYPHVPGQSTCAECDGTKTVARSPRASHLTEIHYGLIASGDRVIKSATKRNLAAQTIGDILCFEMEAAGIATGFSCTAIRGISDYADSHKNDAWHHHAAATAAACAKELLSYLDPEEPLPRVVPSLPPCLGTSSNSESEPVARSDFRGVGVQHSGSGNFSVGGDLHIEYINNAATSGNMHDLYGQFLGDLCESDPSADMSRIEEDKGGLLRNCFDWVLNNAQLKDWQENQDTRLLWIKGDPGKGKTMLMIGLVDDLRGRLEAHQKCALSFFFCQSAEPHLNNAVSVLRGLAWKLLSKYPTLAQYIPEEYRLKSKEKRKAMFESNPNLFATLKAMLAAMLSDVHFETVYLLVDALDECDKTLDGLVEWMSQTAADPQSKVKWLVSGRSNTTLDRTLKPKRHQQKIILELNDEHISRAVSRFVELKVEALAYEGGYSESFRREVQAKLEQKAELTFLWVALACKRLKLVPKPGIMRELDQFPPGLPALYERMMRQIDDQGEEISRLCKRILRAVTIAYRPLTLPELIPAAELHEWSTDDIREFVSLCSSYVILRADTVRFLHLSAKEYLGNVASIFPSGLEASHGLMAALSLHAMSTVLRRDMYSLCAPGFPINSVKQPDPDPLATVRYSCVYWVDHLHGSLSGRTTSLDALRDDGVVDVFLRNKYLYWLEALSLLRGMPQGVIALEKLERLLSHMQKGQLTDLVRDARRFILSYKWVIENAPLQAYASALVFSPTGSLVKAAFKAEKPDWIALMPAMETDWNACLQTLEGHAGPVYSAAFSRDGKHLASASDDKTVKIWDAATGKHLQTLQGHRTSVRSVVFSGSNEHVASASDDGKIKIWDTSSGNCLKTLQGHFWRANSLTLSADSQRLASASYDLTVKIWDVMSGKCLQTLAGHGGTVRSVVFLDEMYCASASYDGAVKIWDVASGRCSQTLEAHRQAINSLAVSDDGKRLASASDDAGIKIWDVRSGKCLQMLEGHRGPVYSVAFWADGTHLASTSDDGTIKIWDVRSGKCLQTLEGHRGPVWSVTLPRDGKHLASTSSDGTVKIWSATLREHLKMPTGHRRSVYSVAFSPNGDRLASASYDLTIKIWDTISGECIQTISENITFRRLSFDHTGSYLVTEIKQIKVAPSRSRPRAIPHHTSLTTPITDAITDAMAGGPALMHYYRLSPDGSWITHNSQNMLWLPSEYRAECHGVWGSTVGIGCRSGRVLVFRFC